jgi:Ca2+-binding EF-hand superfamily protein
MTKKILPMILILLAVAPALAAPGDETAPPRPARPSNSGIMRYDTNKDGFVDRTEWTAGQEARFKQLDTDKDGKLSKDELFSRTGQTADAAVPNERALERQDAFFRRMDSDRDGAVSKAEFMSQADRNFARCDTDKDARTNTAECRQALRRPTAERAGVER